MTTLNFIAANQNFPAFDRLTQLGVFTDIDELFPELPFTPAEQARRMADLKERYEADFPETSAHIAQGLAAKIRASGQEPAPAFTKLVVERAAGRRGWSKSTVKQVIRRGERIKREVLDAIIADGDHANDSVLLDTLVEYGPEQQAGVYAAWKDREPPPKKPAAAQAPAKVIDGWWSAVPGFKDDPDRFTVPGLVDLRLGDSADVLKTFTAESFDAVISDQPYGIGYRGTRGARIANDEDPEPIASWSVSAMARVLRAGSFMVLHGVFRVLPDGREVQEVWRQHLRAAGVPLRDIAVWDKGAPSPLGGYLRHQQELVWVCAKGNARQQCWADVWGLVHDEHGRVVNKDVDLWTIQKPMGGGIDAAHPTSKPVALHMREMCNFVRPGGSVLDPFMGSGSTAVAALKTHHPYVGVEVDPEWFAVAVQRVREQLLVTQPEEAGLADVA